MATIFAEQLHASLVRALEEAQALAEANDSPCGVWFRDGWYTVCELAPELIEPNPEDDGWTIHGVVDPHETEADV